MLRWEGDSKGEMGGRKSFREGKYGNLICWIYGVFWKNECIWVMDISVGACGWEACNSDGVSPWIDKR